MTTGEMIRLAQTGDLEEICQFDDIVTVEEDRKSSIASAVADGRAWVISDGAHIVGYGILNHSFFSRSFVELLYVRQSDRRRGFGATLLRGLEAQSRTKQLYTSANESNTPMRRLLEQEGYRQCGSIEGLDDGDPEVIYVKTLSDT